MNNIALIIYLMGVTDRLSVPAIIFTSLAAVACLALSLVMLIEGQGMSEDLRKQWIYMTKISYVVLLVSLLVGVLTPSSKTLAAMVIVPAVVNNQRLQNIGDTGITILESKMKEWLDSQIKAEAGR